MERTCVISDIHIKITLALPVNIHLPILFIEYFLHTCEALQILIKSQSLRSSVQVDTLVVQPMNVHFVRYGKC